MEGYPANQSGHQALPLGNLSHSDMPLPTSTIVLPILSASALVLQIPLLIWHIRNRNLGASSKVIWISLILIMFIINPILWPRDDYWNWWKGYGLCDIESRILIGASVGLPGSATCIVRKLIAVLNTEETRIPSRAQQRREKMLDIFLCIGFPIIIMVVYYVVQANRYTILTTTGCIWWIDRSWLAIVLVLIWPLVLSMINAYLSIILIWRLYKYRQELHGLLREKGTRKSHFYRLVLIFLILTIGVLPLSIQGVFYPLRAGLHPYSWTETHSEWEPATFPTNDHVRVWYGPTGIALCYLIFICYGLGRDAVEMYKSWLRVFGLEKCFPILLPASTTSTQASSKLTWNSIKASLLRNSSIANSRKDSMSQTATYDRTSHRASTLKSASSPMDEELPKIFPLDPITDLESGRYTFKINDGGMEFDFRHLR